MSLRRASFVTLSLGLPLAAVAAVLGAAAVWPGSASARQPVAPPPPAEAPVATAAAADGFTFAARVDRDAVHQSEGRIRVRVEVGSEHALEDAARVPTDVVVVLDKSGSMGGTKIEDARAAALELVDMLGPEDRFSLVTFDSGARSLIPLSPMRERADAAYRIDGITASGGTDMVGGLSLGARQHASVSGRARKTVLISDGHPNTRDGLRDLALASARSEVPLTTVGIGADYDETLMTSLADAGTGNFYWVTRGPGLAGVFADELAASSRTVASAVQLKPELGRGVRVADAAGLVLDGGDVRVGSLFASQHRDFWLTLDVSATEVGPLDLGALSLVVTRPDGTTSTLHADLPTIDVLASREEALARIDADVWGEGIVQEDYNRMRQEVSQHVQNGDRSAALGTITAYKQRVGGLNETVGSAMVVDNLAEVDQLEAEVEQVIEDRAKANNWAKTTTSGSWSGRRGGSYVSGSASR